MRISRWLMILCLPAVAAQVERRPNILILLADDLGYGELGCYGQEIIRTPNIDALASKGLRFTDFYAGCSVCSPSRGVLMTGIHAGHATIRGNNGFIPEDGTWGRVALEKSEVTLAEMLKAAGYQTAFIGKWHLGIPTDTSTWAQGRGFDFAVQEQWGPTPEGGTFDEQDHWFGDREKMIHYDYTQYDCKDVFRTDLALRFLDEQRDPAKPLFLFMSYRSPHAHEYDLRETERYKERGWPEIERRHAARITMLDEQVQRLLDKLEAMGELDNTFILFSSDNGPHAEGPVDGPKHDPLFFQGSGGLRGYKRDLYEGGIRVPGIVCWKGKAKSGATAHPATFYDVMPTLAEVAGIACPAQSDGISFLPEVLGREQQQHEFLYWEIMEGRNALSFRQAARMGDWKGVRYGAGARTQLFDLRSDPYETMDVAKAHPEVVERIDRILDTQSTKTGHYPPAGGGE